jgi:Tol biopolymer transport system component
MHRRVWVPAAAALLLVACSYSDVSPEGTTLPSEGALGSPTARPSVAMPGGTIVFMRPDASDNWQTWIACPDLSNDRQLTDVKGRNSGWPVLSPDGSRIAIDTDREDPDLDDDNRINDIFSMDTSGGDLLKLTDSVGISGDPAYSPDGQLLAFQADRGDHAKQGIYVMNAADGSDLRRVTKIPADAVLDYAPRFSPDGGKLVFTRQDTATASSLWIVNLDGSDPSPITSGDLAPGDGAWSPDGTRIVFEAYPPTYPNGSIWVVEPDGTGLTNLTADVPGVANGFSDPVYSPDGSRILMLHADSDAPEQPGLAVMNADGSQLRFIGDGRGIEHQPDWTSAEVC